MAQEKTKGDEWLRQKAHDIRNALAVIHGYLRYRDRADLSAEEREYWQAAKDSGGRILAIADALTGQAAASRETLGEAAPAKKMVPLSPSLVLIVDDDEAIQRQWQRLLQDAGLASLAVESGESLLKIKLDLSQLKAAIVDYEFEGSALNGFDIIEYLKRKSVARIHLCTGLFDDEQIRDKARRLGVSLVIPKPIPADIVDKL